jgi:hypothetical protein
MIARFSVPLAHIVEQGQAPSPAGDHEGRPYGSSVFLPIRNSLAVVLDLTHQFVLPFSIEREAVSCQFTGVHRRSLCACWVT